MTSSQVNKKILALHFSGSARKYDTEATLQREIAFQTAQLACLSENGGQAVVPRVLEIGCGTGFLTSFLLERIKCELVVAVDLSDGMLCRAGQNLGRLSPPVRLVQADGELLPMAGGAFDLVVSSTTFQWFEDLDSALGAIRRVLRPGGRLVFATLLRGTFRELRESYRAAAGSLGIRLTASRYGLTLPGAQEVRDLLHQHGFGGIETREQAKFEYFPSAVDFLRSIKARGGNNPNFRPMSLPVERALLKKMTSFYNDRFRIDGRVCVTYEVIFAQASVLSRK